jgi:hypothetical protein
MILTAVIVAVVYSLAQDANLAGPLLARKIAGRFGKLAGVLAVLGVLVFILSKI